MSQLEDIKARLAAASPWPWKWRRDYDGTPCYLHPRYEPEGDWDFPPSIITTDSGVYGPRGGDADLIEHAPDDIAWLVAEVERLRGMVRPIKRTTRPEAELVDDDDEQCCGCSDDSCCQHGHDCRVRTRSRGR